MSPHLIFSGPTCLPGLILSTTFVFSLSAMSSTSLVLLATVADSPVSLVLSTSTSPAFPSRCRSIVSSSSALQTDCRGDEQSVVEQPADDKLLCTLCNSSCLVSVSTETRTASAACS